MAERRGLEGPQALKASSRGSKALSELVVPASIASVIGAAASRISMVGFEA
jgi:hypothetical protein